MTLRRFFIESDRLQQERPSLEGEEAKHIQRVLRLGPGDHAVLFDNTGWEYEVQITGLQSGHVFYDVLGKKKVPRESPLRIILAVPLIRPQPLEWIYQKGTELGVDSFYPYYSCYSGRNFSSREWRNKQDRWKRIITESAKQCGRNRLPELMSPCSFDRVLETEDSALRILPYEGKTVYTLKEIADRYPETVRVMACIGPEGGFSPEEVRKAEEKDYFTISLGPRILRAETAVLTLVGLLQYLWGDLGENSKGGSNALSEVRI